MTDRATESDDGTTDDPAPTRPRTDLRIVGDAAVVTGSGRGIGRAIATALARAGVSVAINDVDPDAVEAGVAAVEAAVETAAHDAAVIGVPGDAAAPEDMAHLVERAVEAFGGLDVLVNNVGIAGPTKPVEAVTNEEFMNTLAVNLGGHFNATTAAVDHLRAGEGSGRIVNLSSMTGKRPLRDRTPYTTSKMGVIGFTRTLAVELAEDDVTVNAVCPGSVTGSRLDRVIEGQAAAQDRAVEAVRQEFREVSPQNTFVDPEDVADAVLWLCSEQAAHVTGEDLNVSAGIVMY